MNCYSDKYKFSFIVIGRNEGWKLSICFQSILDCVEECGICNYEILYIDSHSVDDSLERAKRIPFIKTYSITGKCNAAIARNIGGKEAQGDVLFFLDGDMELQVDFIPHIFNETGCMVHPLVSGINYHWYYDKGWNLLNKKKPDESKNDYFKNVLGGFFIIKKPLWDEMGGMDTRLSINEDYDLGFRIAKKGICAWYISKIGVIHHTIPYSDRIFGYIAKYRYPAFLMRKHLLNKHYWSFSWRMNYTVIILFLSLTGMIVFSYSWVFYLSILLLRSVSKGIRFFPKKLVFILIRDIVFLAAFLFYYPTKVHISYMQCK